MKSRLALKVYWRSAPPRCLVQRAEALISRKCRKYGDRAKLHTLWCCGGEATQEAGERQARLDGPVMTPTLSSCAFFSALGLYLQGDQDGAAARLASAALALRPSFFEARP